MKMGGNNMAKRKIEIFSAGCPVCKETVELVKRLSCSSSEIAVLDMKDPTVATRANSLGIRSVPAIVVDGSLASCCAGRGPDEAALRAAGIGQPL
jgi:glutaredoxin